MLWAPAWSLPNIWFETLHWSHLPYLGNKGRGEQSFLQMCTNRAIRRRIVRLGCLFRAEPPGRLLSSVLGCLCSPPRIKPGSACASYRSLATRYLLYPSTKLNIFNGEVRILKFKTRLRWTEKLLFLKDALEHRSILCDRRLWNSNDSCLSPSPGTHFQLSWTCALSSSVQGFWWAVCRFYWTSVNPQLGYASSYCFHLFLGYGALGSLAKGAGETSVRCCK